MKYTELETKVSCEQCGHTFKAKELLLKPFGTGVSLGSHPLLCFKYIDKNDKIMGGFKPPTKEDRIMHCPKCEAPHLFGFE